MSEDQSSTESDHQLNEAFQRSILEEMERDRDAKEAVLAALASEDAYAFSDAIEGLSYTNAWRSVFLAIRRYGNPAPSFRAEVGGYLVTSRQHDPQWPQ